MAVSGQPSSESVSGRTRPGPDIHVRRLRTFKRRLNLIGIAGEIFSARYQCLDYVAIIDGGSSEHGWPRRLKYLRSTSRHNG